MECVKCWADFVGEVPVPCPVCQKSADREARLASAGWAGHMVELGGFSSPCSAPVAAGQKAVKAPNWTGGGSCTRVIDLMTVTILDGQRAGDAVTVARQEIWRL